MHEGPRSATRTTAASPKCSCPPGRSPVTESRDRSESGRRRLPDHRRGRRDRPAHGPADRGHGRRSPGAARPLTREPPNGTGGRRTPGARGGCPLPHRRRDRQARAADRGGADTGAVRPPHRSRTRGGSARRRPPRQQDPRLRRAGPRAQDEGIAGLDAVTGDYPLDYLLIHSSLASAVGSVGGADYSAANRALDAFASWREERRTAGARHGRTLAVDWPLWRDGGCGSTPNSRTGYWPGPDSSARLAHRPRHPRRRTRPRSGTGGRAARRPRPADRRTRHRAAGGPRGGRAVGITGASCGAVRRAGPTGPRRSLGGGHGHRSAAPGRH